MHACVAKRGDGEGGAGDRKRIRNDRVQIISLAGFTLRKCLVNVSYVNGHLHGNINFHRLEWRSG